MMRQVEGWTAAAVVTVWVFGVSVLTLTPAAAQEGAAQSALGSHKALDRPASGPRTPWGHPDLQGTWTSEPEFGVPFERPAEFGNRQSLTDAEYAQRLARTQKQAEAALDEIDVFAVDTSNAGAVGSPTSPPPHWLERSTASRRTSLVVDPPDGRLPPTSAQAQERQRRQPRGSFGNGPFNGPEDFTQYDRCITFGGVPGAMFPAVYNANIRIIQSPDFLAITYEMIHETRLVPLDGRAHLAPTTRQSLGDARGRWEGDILVIETTNFSGRTSYRGASDKLRLVERFRRVDEKTLQYEVTVEDPDTWARPWTAALTLTPQPQGMFEYACHEGNYGMFNMLKAARAAEKP